MEDPTGLIAGTEVSAPAGARLSRPGRAVRKSLALGLAWLLLGCGGFSGPPEQASFVTLPPDTQWPVEIEGELSIDIEDGRLECPNGLSEVNLGSIRTLVGKVSVDIRCEVLAAGGLHWEDTQRDLPVRATLSGLSELSDPTYPPPMYNVIAVTKVRDDDSED